jgi:hypothetical protein
LLALLFFLAAPLHSQEPKHPWPSEPDTPVDHSVGVLSSQRLNPPLRAGARLRFSPDGSHLLIQDQAGILVLAHKPLHVLLYADIGIAYPAAFSADSQSLSILGHDLVLTTWRLSDPNQPARRELPVQQGCLDAQVSPDAAWIACFTPEFFLDLYRTSDFQRVYSQRLSAVFTGGAFVPIARNYDSPFSAPFGYMFADFSALADRGTFHSAVYFAPDATFLLVNHEAASFRLDLPSLHKSDLPRAMRKKNRVILGFPSDDHVLVSEFNSNKEPVHQVISLATGDVLGALAFTADTVALASNSRFALLMDSDAPGVTLFDLEKNIVLSTPSNLGADVYGDELALCNAEGELRLYHVGEERPAAAGRLPLGPFPVFGAALADPSLTTLALSLQGVGATFALATGNRLSALRSFRGAWFDTAESAFFGVPRRGKAFPSVLRWASGQSAPSGSPVWKADQAHDLVSSRSAFISYSLYQEMGLYFGMGFRGTIPFELHGLDPSSGRVLWDRAFERFPPVPFSDPQGDRMVLGWQAHTAPALSAANRFPAAREAYKKQKVKDQDSFFEVLDAASGVSLGGVLVQFGSGPASFDSAFSVGNFLFLLKDPYRLTVFRLNDGTLFGRFRGNYPAVSDSAKLLALDDGAGKLTFYNLGTAAKLAERKFPDYINYLCFSEKGDRLLVLTAHQMVYILDVKKTILAFPAAPAPTTEPSADSSPQNP